MHILIKVVIKVKGGLGIMLVTLKIGEAKRKNFLKYDGSSPVLISVCKFLIDKGGEPSSAQLPVALNEQ